MPDITAITRPADISKPGTNPATQNRSNSASSQADDNRDSFEQSYSKLKAVENRRADRQERVSAQDKGGNALPDESRSGGNDAQEVANTPYRAATDETGQQVSEADGDDSVLSLTTTAERDASSPEDKLSILASTINIQSSVEKEGAGSRMQQAELDMLQAKVDHLKAGIATAKTVDSGAQATAPVPATVLSESIKSALKPVSTATPEPAGSTASMQASERLMPANDTALDMLGLNKTDVLFKQTMQRAADTGIDMSALKNGMLNQSSLPSTSISAMTSTSAQPLAGVELSGFMPANTASANNLATPLSNSSAIYQADINQPFGSVDWSKGLGKQVVMLVNQNIRSAELRLNPANMGTVEVRIDMEDDQVNVAFTSRHAAVRDAIEVAMPRLREMMDSNGLSLADTDISDQSFAQQSELAFADKNSGRESESSYPGAIAVDDENSSAIKPVTISQVEGLVDMYI